jgi:hypothetical protein
MLGISNINKILMNSEKKKDVPTKFDRCHLLTIHSLTQRSHNSGFSQCLAIELWADCEHN